VEIRPVSEVLPQKPPFLFVDRVLELSEKKIVAERLFRPDESYFAGHFPDKPIVPGVLLLEGLAQTMAYLSLSIRKADRIFLIGIDKARFRGFVEPGTTVTYQVETGEERFSTLNGRGWVREGKRRIADADLIGYAGSEGGPLG
jgi:3-hydroxyacyl-[acyl-carrier-protein] dehydratase